MFLHCRIIKGALSRYSVTFYAILLMGKLGGRAFYSNEARATSVLFAALRSVECTVLRRNHNCTWKIAGLGRSSDHNSPRSIRGALQACFRFDAFFLTLFTSATAGQPCLFVLTFLISSESQTLWKRRTTLHGQLTDTSTSITCEAPNLKWKRCSQCRLLRGRHGGLGSPRRHFRP